ncbi:MAG: murein biosynthesis integral membrane protein MurJ [bacterium]
MSQSTNRKIALVSAMLMVTTAVGHSFSLVKEIIVAKFFGITGSMDAFYAALSVPNLIGDVIIGTLSVVFIPAFISLKLKDPKEADKIASVVLNWAILLISVIIALIFVVGPQVIEFGFHGLTPETGALASRLLRLLSLGLLLSTAAGVITGILNAQKHFFWPAASQMFITAGIILMTLLFADTLGVYALVWGLLGGLFLKAICLFPVAKAGGFKYSLTLDWKRPAIKEILFFGAFMLAASAAGLLNPLIDQMMTSHLATGSISALNYANKAVQAPFMIFSFPMVTAVFPFFSAQAAENSMEELGYSLTRSIRMTGFIFMPMTLILTVLAGPLIRLLFQRGAFTAAAAELTSVVFICYLPQLFFLTCGMIMSRAFFALKEFKIYLIISATLIFLNVGFNLLFINLVNPPVAGIALSTSFVQLVMATLLFSIIKKRIASLDTGDMATGLSKIVLASLFSAAAAYFVCRGVYAGHISGSVIKQAAAVGVSGISGIAVFALASYFLRLDELKSMALMIRDKICPENAAL